MIWFAANGPSKDGFFKLFMTLHPPYSNFFFKFHNKNPHKYESQYFMLAIKENWDFPHFLFAPRTSFSLHILTLVQSLYTFINIPCVNFNIVAFFKSFVFLVFIAAVKKLCMYVDEMIKNLEGKCSWNSKNKKFIFICRKIPLTFLLSLNTFFFTSIYLTGTEM